MISERRPPLLTPTTGAVGVLMTLLLLTVRAETPEDWCEVARPSVYCRCELRRSENAPDLSCFIHGPLDPEDVVWAELGRIHRAARLDFNCHPGFELNFVPAGLLRALTGLRSLRFRQARLGILPSRALANNGLTDVDLNSNEIEGLAPAALADMPKLENLSLTDNRLREIGPGQLVGLTGLRRLYLNGNQIGAVRNGAFRQLPVLDELDLSNNLLIDLELESFVGPSHLRLLDLYGNLIERLPADLFLPLPGLRRLDLRRNRLISVHRLALRGLDQLVSLQMDRNHLETLPEGFFSPAPELREVGLSFNQLRTLPVPLPSDHRGRRDPQFVFRLKENPLNCDCRLWLTVRHYLNESTSHAWKEELRHVVCRPSPSHPGAVRVVKLWTEGSDCPEDPSEYSVAPRFPSGPEGGFVPPPSESPGSGSAQPRPWADPHPVAASALWLLLARR